MASAMIDVLLEDGNVLNQICIILKRIWITEGQTGYAVASFPKIAVSGHLQAYLQASKQTELMSHTVQCAHRLEGQTRTHRPGKSLMKNQSAA